MHTTTMDSSSRSGRPPQKMITFYHWYSVCFTRGMTNIKTDLHTSTMHAAFELVKPPTHWKAPIDYRVRTNELKLALAGRAITIEQVCEAVEFFTATKAKVREEMGFTYITAPGYWAGPAC